MHNHGKNKLAITHTDQYYIVIQLEKRDTTVEDCHMVVCVVCVWCLNKNLFKKIRIGFIF